MRQSAAFLLALSSCVTASAGSEEKVFACGLYRYEFNDALQFREGDLSADNSILIVRDQANHKLLLAMKKGEPMRFAALLIDPCKDPRGNTAACVQGGHAAIILLRPMTPSETCTTPEELLRSRPKVRGA